MRIELINTRAMEVSGIEVKKSASYPQKKIINKYIVYEMVF